MKKMVIILVLASLLIMALGVNFALGSTHVSVCGQFHHPPEGLEGPFEAAHEMCHELGVPSADIPVDAPVTVPHL